MNSIDLDRKREEKKKAVRFENLLLKMFEENIRYLLRMYKELKLPKSMFTQSQVEILEDVSKLLSVDEYYYLIRELS